MKPCDILGERVAVLHRRAHGEEREIILREASVGVSLPAVVLSKAAVLLLVEVLQAAILAFGFVSIVHVPQNHLLLETDMEIFITVC